MEHNLLRTWPCILLLAGCGLDRGFAGSRDANSDGAVLKGNVWTNSPDGEDGAGATSMVNIKRILDRNSYAYLELEDADFVSCGPDCREYVVTTVNLPYQYAFRAAMVYSACSEDPSGATIAELENDLDLYVRYPFNSWQGTITATRSSTSIDNEVEMVFLDGPLQLAGNRTIAIRLKGGTSFELCGDEPDEPVAVVWDYWYEPAGGGIDP